MSKDRKGCGIKIQKDGPYVVTGSVPLSEKIIVPKGRGYELKDGRELPQAETYALCRCGKSKQAPFCDGSHERGFVGTETASRAKYEDRVQIFEGPDLDLLDDGRCAFGRFCHSEKGITTWELIDYSDRPEYRDKAIKTASECPSGRLTAVDKAGNMIEPDYEPSIEIIQDPEEEVSAGIFVKGNIPIEAADGHLYEIRNRVALCRCGKSRTKPFCDATHVTIGFLDEE